MTPRCWFPPCIASWRIAAIAAAQTLRVIGISRSSAGDSSQESNPVRPCAAKRSSSLTIAQVAMFPLVMAARHSPAAMGSRARFHADVSRGTLLRRTAAVGPRPQCSGSTPQASSSIRSSVAPSPTRRHSWITLRVVRGAPSGRPRRLPFRDGLTTLELLDPSVTARESGVGRP